jgi:polysaccharide biosynthesis protein PslH
MNVLWIAHSIPYPPSAGFLLRSYNLLRELANVHTVDLIAFVQEPWLRAMFPEPKEGLEQSARVLRQFCRHVDFLPIDNLNRWRGKETTALHALLTGSAYTTSWLASNAARSTIASALVANSYDLVHFDTLGLAPYQDLAVHLPTTLTHHNVESHMMLRRADNARGILARAYFRHEGRLVQAYEQRIASKFTAHFTCSALDSDRLLKVAPDANVIVIPNGVDCEFFASADVPARAHSLVFVGTLSWYPNSDAMMYFLNEVWPRLKQRVPTATLDIAGSGPPGSLVELARSAPGVTIHGYLEDVRPLIDSSSVVVCPIRDGGGTKLKILDAFALKKCVVAHPIACEGIDVTRDRDIVLAESSTEFVDQLTTLLDDSLRRKSIGEAARRLVEAKYSYRSIGAKFRSALEHASQARSAA